MFKPTFDYVYFRLVDHEIVFEEKLIVPAGFTYLPNELENGGHRLTNRAVEKQEGPSLARCLAVGPGRVLPSGAMRVPPCEPGDIFVLDRKVMAGAITKILWDDGTDVLCIGSEFINGVRKDLPKWAKEKVPGEETKKVLVADLTPSATKAAEGSN